MQNKTKIIATIGPACRDIKTLVSMIEAGMSVARLNFSHGDINDHTRLLHNIRKAAKQTKKRVAVIQDLPGPKIRTGDLETETVTLVAGEKLVLTTKQCLGDSRRMSVSYKKLAQDVKTGDVILLNDGQQELEVLSVSGSDIHTKIIAGGEVRSRRGLHVRGSALSIASFTAQDKRDIVFGIEQGVEYVALSFVQSARDIRAARRVLDAHGSAIKIIAKIETAAAVENLEEIMQSADAVMIARGDLAIEMGAAMVPVLQKQIIVHARAMSCPVIVATQMLESMTHDILPTRAEASDVANAVYDTVDAVMLSGETATGDFPTETIAMMNSIVSQAEQSQYYRSGVRGCDQVHNATQALVEYAEHMADDLNAVAIVVFSQTGHTLQLQSACRPIVPILARSISDTVLNQSALWYAVIPEWNVCDISKQSKALATAANFVSKQVGAQVGDRAIVLSGETFGVPGSVDTLSVVTL